MIEQERIDRAKDVDLVKLFRSRGIKLSRVGKGYQGICPFHSDKSPSLSVTPQKGVWNCLGCDKGGDSIRFVELYDKVDFKEAVSILSDTPLRAAVAVEKKKTAKRLSVSHYKLLEKVIEHYFQSFTEETKARKYLEGRGITKKSLFSSYRIGYSNGSLLKSLAEDGEVVDKLKDLGILNEKGTEHFYNCVTFPLYNNGKAVGLYGRRISGSGAEHLYLSGNRKGIFNPQTVKTNTEIIITESIIDSLTLINAGITNTIPAYGTNGLLAEHIKLLQENGIKKTILCFDNDEGGRKGLVTNCEKLEKKGIAVETISLPESKDINSFFLSAANPKIRFQKLLPADKAVKKEKYSPFAHGYTVLFDKRLYEVVGISKKPAKLKATVKGLLEEDGKKRFHVDTVDFYSARSRAFIAKGLSGLFREPESVIAEDLNRLLEYTENYEPPSEEDQGEVITPEARQAALSFLNNPGLLRELIRDIETVGYTGEEMNKLLCYLAAISRKMEDPLSIMIQSRSAAGKSHLQDTILSMIPEGDYIKYTRLTDQSLFYQDRYRLMHKILAVEELDGLSGAIYSIRTIQSSKRLTVAYVGKDPATGEMKSEEKIVEGPLMIFITTTQVDIDGETASRFLFLSIDESEEMTEKILAKQRHSHTMEGLLDKLKSEEIIKKHLAINKFLEPITVINPYGDLLKFSSKSLRARRDNMKYLNLIRAITFIYQFQRKRKILSYGNRKEEYISVTLNDIEMANNIANEVLGRSLDELSTPSRKLLEMIQDMCQQRTADQNDEVRFTRRDIRIFTGWSDFQIRTHINQLEDLEYIFSTTGRKGKEYVYELIVREGGEDGESFLVGLVNMEELREKAKKIGIKD